jgi:hypothetical protein
MENSAYMESVAGDRAVHAYDSDEQGAFDGAQLISAETDPDLQREQDIFIFINENFAAFLGYLRNLSLRDQELLLAYYCLRKTQTPSGVRLEQSSGNSPAGRSASRDAPARSTETAKG